MLHSQYSLIITPHVYCKQFATPQVQLATQQDVIPRNNHLSDVF